MISFNYLGGLGRLGNQMFQVASLAGIASNRGFEFCLPNSRNITLYDVFNLKKFIKNKTNYALKELDFGFDENAYNSCEDNVDIIGYMQSEKYFINIKKYIKELFSFNEDTFKICKEYISFLNSEVISLHIRRTDYINDPNHVVQDLKYYMDSLDYINKRLPVLVFSDDIAWCEEQFFFKDKKFKIIKSNNQEIDLCLMTMCNYHIIANSSFSWWGSWLSNSKITVAPKSWYKSDSIFPSKDIYSSNWAVL